MGTRRKQDIDLHRKLALRRDLLAFAQAGPTYVPFIGDADIADQLYRGRRLYGADIDPARVAVAAQRFPGENIIVGDCNKWVFPGVTAAFSVADFDSYSEPYTAFQAFWRNAEKADTLVLFFTDGHRQGIKRRGEIHYPDGRKWTTDSLAERRSLFNFWFIRHVLPWFCGYIKPWRKLISRNYVRGMMLYWGAVIERGE